MARTLGRMGTAIDLTSISPISLGSDFMSNQLPTTTSTIGGIIGGALSQIAGQILQQAPGGLGAGSIYPTSPITGQTGVPAITYQIAGQSLRKRRRMNVLNPKALRRGMRRVQGFAHFARKCITFTHRVHMKKRCRRK